MNFDIDGDNNYLKNIHVIVYKYKRKIVSKYEFK